VQDGSLRKQNCKHNEATNKKFLINRNHKKGTVHYKTVPFLFNILTGSFEPLKAQRPENHKSKPFCPGFSRTGKTDSSATALEFRLRNVDL
jgi:hypothetical protein